MRIFGGFLVFSGAGLLLSPYLFPNTNTTLHDTIYHGVYGIVLFGIGIYCFIKANSLTKGQNKKLNQYYSPKTQKMLYILVALMFVLFLLGVFFAIMAMTQVSSTPNYSAHSRSLL